MPEFMVAIDHITYYAVQAEDEVTAIDRVLEGQPNGSLIGPHVRQQHHTQGGERYASTWTRIGLGNAGG
jgi:hypothetical protein